MLRDRDPSCPTATLHKKYGSSDLLKVLSSLGFTCSYFEVQLFQASVLQDPPQVVLEDSFNQWMHDNADVNVDTIDGSNSWHAMRGLQCITPLFSACSEARIPRLKKVPTAKETGAFLNIPLVTFQKTKQHGLESICIYDINGRNSIDAINQSASDFMWLYEKWRECLDLPGWNGLWRILPLISHFRKLVLCAYHSCIRLQETLTPSTLLSSIQLNEKVTNRNAALCRSTNLCITKQER